MLNRLSGLLVLGGLLCVSCGTPDELVLKNGMTVVGSDLRIGLTADGRTGEPVRMRGLGFEQIGEKSYVRASAGEPGSGSLADGGTARAAGAPASVWDLRGEVFAMPAPGGTRSDAQVVELATSDVMVHEILPEGRFAMETELRATMGNNAVSICKVEAELNYDGTLMGQVKGVYYLYGSEGGNRVEIYRGARGADGSEHLAVVGAGERYVVKESSFFFKLGPGQHELVFSMSAQASSPLDAEPGFGDPGGQASLQAVARLRVE